LNSPRDPRGRAAPGHPSLMADVYRPPPPPATTTSGTAETAPDARQLALEKYVASLDWKPFTPGDRSSFQTVANTRNGWRGCDVTVAPPTGLTYLNADKLHFVAYTAQEGIPVVPVDSGFYDLGQAQAQDFGAKRVISARAVAERFEVRMQLMGTGAVAVPKKFTATLIAHNEALQPIAPTAALRLPRTSPVGLVGVDLRFFGLRARNLNAAVRYMQVFDQTAIPILADVPIWTFPMNPVNTDGSIIEVYPPEALTKWLHLGCQVTVSSTYAFCTPAVLDAEYDVWIL
jgi:hypothetical protein